MTSQEDKVESKLYVYEFYLDNDKGGGSLLQKVLLTFHSKAPIAIPDVTAVPARPRKWPVPIFEAKREAPS